MGTVTHLRPPLRVVGSEPPKERLADLHYLYHPRVQEGRLKAAHPMPLAAGEVAEYGHPPRWLGVTVMGIAFALVVLIGVGIAG